MSLTSLLGRESIRTAVECLVDAVDLSLVNDIKTRDEEWGNKYDELQAEANEVRQRLATAETANRRFEDDNRSLREKVAELTATVVRMTAEAAGAGAAPIDQSFALKQSLETALARYESARKNRDALVDVARRRKTEVKKWIEYAESLERKVRRLEKRVAEKTIQAAAPTAGGPGPANVKPEDVQKPSHNTSFHSSFSASFLDSLGGNLDRADDEPDLPSRAPNSAAAVETTADSHEGTLDSTQSDPSWNEPSPLQEPELPAMRALHTEQSDQGPSDVRVKQEKEPLSDEPEVVWARPVKRQRNAKPQAQNRVTDATPRVKKEPVDRTDATTVPAASTSWPASSMIRESQESMDLDEGQLAMPTPRKRQPVFRDVPLQNDGGSLPSSQLMTQDRVAESPVRNSVRGTPLATLSTNVQRGSRAGTDPAKNKSTGKSLKRGAEALQDGADDKSTRLWSMLHKAPREGQGRTLLDEVRARTAATETLLETVRGRAAASEGPNRPTATPKQPATAAATPATARAGRPNRSLVDAMKARAAAREGAGQSAASPAVATATTTPGPTVTAASTPRTTTTPLAAKDAATSARKGPPLRERPIDQLTLQDFKINPARNDGATFAYNEVVRSRVDRGSLAGCTDPQCCGKVFRAMASSELEASLAARGARAGSPGAAAAVAAYINRPDSIVTMEKYLGDEAYVLAQMSPAEKRELWLEARTHELADKYGKHRHRFHRRASPPGFWDADFPTSQEEERYRAEAAKQDKAAVQERYREAMRPNRAGRWLFRDE